MDRIELTILKNLLCDETYTRKVIPFIESEYFADRSERLIFEGIDSFFEQFNRLPTKETLAIDIDKNPDLNEDGFKAVLSVLSDIAVDDSYSPPAQDWMIDNTETFCQDKAVYNAVRESIQILDGSSEFNKEAIPEMLSQALGVSFDTNIGHDFLEDSDERFAFYHRKEKHLPFDIEYMNKITNGGLSPKTLNVFMGGPGSGKTLVLCHLAANYLMQGTDVLYITLEMAEERISERVDANLLNVKLDDLQNLPKSMYDKKVEAIRAKTSGKLVVKEYPTSQAGAAHFRHLLNELILKKNFSPAVVIVDYINICMSSRIKMGTTNSYGYVKAIAEELRGLGVEKKVTMISATQVNREGFGSSDMGMENTSESFGLPATCDLFIALITTPELQDLGQIMMKQLKNRYADENKHRRFVVGMDKSKMRLFDCEQAAQVNITQEAADTPAFDATKFGKAAKKDFSSIQGL